MKNEVGFSLAIAKHGYNVRSIMAAYYKSNMSIPVPTKVPVVEHCMTNGYFGVNIHPYEVIFIKDNRDINKNLDIDAVTRHLLSGFNSLGTAKSPAAFVVTPAMPMTAPISLAKIPAPAPAPVPASTPTPVPARINTNTRQPKIPTDFNWRTYLDLNADIAGHIQSEERARYHWTYYGSREGRPYK